MIYEIIGMTAIVSPTILMIWCWNKKIEKHAEEQMESIQHIYSNIRKFRDEVLTEMEIKQDITKRKIDQLQKEIEKLKLNSKEITSLTGIFNVHNVERYKIHEGLPIITDSKIYVDE